MQKKTEIYQDSNAFVLYIELLKDYSVFMGSTLSTNYVTER